MKLFLAGADRHYQHLLPLDNLAFLVSYFYLKKNKSTWKLIDLCNKKNIPIMLDCGAWSAMNRSITINNQEFIDFCLKHEDKFNTIISLDVIGNPKKTRENYEQAIKQGLSLVPTFHIDSSFEYLEYYVSKTNHIGLGGIASRTTEIQTYNWLKYIYNQYPDIKFHGFGVTTPKLLRSFNWHSVDGTTWITGALRYGRIMYNRNDGTFKWIHLNNTKQLKENWHLIKDDISDGWSLVNGRTEQYEQVAMKYNAKSLIELVDYCSNNKIQERQMFLL